VEEQQGFPPHRNTLTQQRPIPKPILSTYSLFNTSWDWLNAHTTKPIFLSVWYI